jgi:LacI family transcriptional regulator
MLLSVVTDSDEERIYRDLQARGAVDGVIIHAPSTDDPRITLLHELGIPFVVHGRSSGAALPYSWVDVNNRRAFQRATEFLLDLGHRRIGLVNGLEHMDFAVRRRTGYVDALTARQIEIDPALMATDEMTESRGHRAAARMLDEPDPPTALVVSSIISALGARRAVEARGLKVGRDVSLIIHDDDLSYLKNGEDVPIFTATRSSVRQAGGIAAQMLLDIIANPDGPAQSRLLEADLIIGQSTGPLRP